MFKEDRNESQFSWEDLGNIEEGRPNLGDKTSVSVYRLMQYTLRDILIKRFDPVTAGEIFYEAGHSAGESFCKNMLNLDLELNEFVAELQEKLKEFGVGILRVEKLDPEKLDMTISVYEDLDCSGLPMHDETVCDYDEGFIAGILKAYTNLSFKVKEVDCWATGDRVCRFDVVKE